MEIKTLMEEAKENGEVLTISYAGGSQPGKSRQIIPLQVYDDKIRARCYTTNAVKTFMLSKISIEKSTNKTEFDTTPKWYDVSYPSLDDLYKHEKENLEAMGWTVVLDLNCLSLHTLFKNGNLRKTPVAEIRYEETTDELTPEDIAVLKEMGEEMGFNTTDLDQPIHRRPWKVRGGETGSSFSIPSKAFSRFLQLAAALAAKQTAS